MLNDFYTKLSKQERIFLYCALGAIGVAAFDFIFFQRFSSKLAALDTQIAQTKDDIKRDVRYLAYTQKIFKENEAYKVYQPEEQKRKDQIFSVFLGTVENFAKELDLNLGKISSGDVVTKKGYALYFANIECSGKFENIIKLIHKIDTTTNLLKVVKLNIAGKKSSADEVTVGMQISKLILDAQSQGDGKNPEKSQAVSNDNPTSRAMNLGGLSVAASLDGKGSPASKGKGGFAKTSPDKGALGSGGGQGSGQGAANNSQSLGDNQSGASEGGGAQGGGAQGGGDQSGGAEGGGAEGGGVQGGGAQGGGANGGSRFSLGSASSAAGKNGTKGESMGISAQGTSKAAAADLGGDSDSTEQMGDGSSSRAGSSKFSKSKTDKKEKSQAQEKISPEKKSSAALDKVSTGERVQVKTIESLWNDFWGIKPQADQEKTVSKTKNTDVKNENKQEDEEDDTEVNPNRVDKIFHRNE